MSVHDYPRNHGSLAGLSGTDHHTQYVLVTPGLASARPAPARYGRIYTATDTGTISLDLGASWVELVRGDQLTPLTTWAADFEAQMSMEVAP